MTACGRLGAYGSSNETARLLWQQAVRLRSRTMHAGIQQECLGHIGDIEAAMVKEFPYEVPSEWKDLPQLKARAAYSLAHTAWHEMQPTLAAAAH